VNTVRKTDCKPTAVTVERAPASALGPFTLKRQAGKGRLYFDPGQGRLVEAERAQELDLESGPPGQKESVVWKLKLSLSTRLISGK
jgi:hypothetical protein